MDSILLKFLIILTVLFFLPKVINRFFKVPSAISEVTLGVILGITLPSLFFLDDMLAVLSTIGIIILFFSAGMDVNADFIKKNRRYFLEHVLLHVVLILVIGAVVSMLFSLSLLLGLLIAIALATPSASYILSSVKQQSTQVIQWVENKAIAGELVSLLLFVILIRLGTPLLMLGTLVIIALIILLLPHALEWLYNKLFSKLIGTEFSFLFVVAIISAFITEYIGLHFLIGAFVAGLVARGFVNDLVKEKKYRRVSKKVGAQLLGSFGFFASTFVPFYFFSVGLKMEASIFSVQSLLIAVGLCAGVISLRLLFMTLHRQLHFKENLLKALRLSNLVIPTLVFTFVLAELLKESIPALLFGVLLIYGVLTAITSLIIEQVLLRRH